MRDTNVIYTWDEYGTHFRITEDVPGDMRIQMLKSGSWRFVRLLGAKEYALYFADNVRRWKAGDAWYRQ